MALRVWYVYLNLLSEEKGCADADSVKEHRLGHLEAQMTQVLRSLR
jgi:hypothetical protein